MEGYVYVLSNPAMPSLVKIGRSIESGRKRANDIYQTGVPVPFVVEFEILSDDCVALESAAHDALESKRVSKEREFFKVDVDEAIDAVVSEFCAMRDLAVVMPDFSVLDDEINMYTLDVHKQCNASAIEVAQSIKAHLSVDSILAALQRYQEQIERRRAQIKPIGGFE